MCVSLVTILHIHEAYPVTNYFLVPMQAVWGIHHSLLMPTNIHYLLMMHHNIHSNRAHKDSYPPLSPFHPSPQYIFTPYSSPLPPPHSSIPLSFPLPPLPNFLYNTCGPFNVLLMRRPSHVCLSVCLSVCVCRDEELQSVKEKLGFECESLQRLQLNYQQDKEQL